MLKQNNLKWKEIAMLLKGRNLSYLQIAKITGMAEDQIKYVATTQKIYKNPYKFIFTNENISILKDLISKYMGLKDKEMAYRINKSMHKSRILPATINITKDNLVYWRLKLGYKKNSSIIKLNHELQQKVIMLLEKRCYNHKEIAETVGLSVNQVDYIAHKHGIKQLPLNILIENPAAWAYFERNAKDLFSKGVKYKKMASLLNKELHSKNFIPQKVVLSTDSLRLILRNKFNLPKRMHHVQTHGFKAYSDFIKQVLKEKKIISKEQLHYFMHDKFKLKKDSCEQIYMQLRWNKVIASSIQRPLKYILVDWVDGSKYKIRESEGKKNIWFTGKGRFTNADLIQSILLEQGHPMTYGQIVQELKDKFGLSITGWDLGAIINSERRRIKKLKSYPKVDVIIHKIKNYLLFLYVVPNKITTNEITTDIEKELIQNYRKDLKDHLKGTIEGKQIDKCLKTVACSLWDFKKDYVLKNKKRPDLISRDKIIEIKKILDNKTLTSIKEKYGHYANQIEVWYLYKKTLNIPDKDEQISIKSIKEVLNNINKNSLPKEVMMEFEYLREKVGL